jgi:hypothetical protein
LHPRADVETIGYTCCNKVLTIMSKSKLDIVQARQCRGEELRIGFILAALKASRPLKLASTRKGVSRRAASQRLEAQAA